MPLIGGRSLQALFDDFRFERCLVVHNEFFQVGHVQSANEHLEDGKWAPMVGLKEAVTV